MQLNLVSIQGNIGDYPSHGSMMSWASKNDKLRLFELAGDDNQIPVSPQMPSNQFVSSSDTKPLFQQHTCQVRKNIITKTTACSSTSMDGSNPLTFFSVNF